MCVSSSNLNFENNRQGTWTDGASCIIAIWSGINQNNRIEYEGSTNRKRNAINVSTEITGLVEEWTEESALQGNPVARGHGGPRQPCTHWGMDISDQSILDSFLELTETSGCA